MLILFRKINEVLVYLGHGIIHRKAIIFAQVSFSVRGGAPRARSLRKNRMNLYHRRTSRREQPQRMHVSVETITTIFYDEGRIHQKHKIVMIGNSTQNIKHFSTGDGGQPVKMPWRRPLTD